MSDLFIIKIAVSVFFVTALSIVAEKHGPKIAGILAGYPTGTAISLFFFGVEISSQFASSSVPYNLLGVIATQVFIYFYYKSSEIFKNAAVILSSLFAILSYLVAIYILSFLKVDLFSSFFIVFVSTVIFIQLFKEIKDTKIENRVKLNSSLLLLRAFIAASIILIITEIAKSISPQWAGLISSFPSTVFPLILIIHITYKKENVYSIIKNIPVGNIPLLFYSVSVAIGYPIYGVYTGTLISFGVVTLLTFLIYKIQNHN